MRAVILKRDQSKLTLNNNCRNTIFAHDHLRFWETVYGQKLPCDKSLSPSKKASSTNPSSPKVNRRYMNRNRFDEDSLPDRLTNYNTANLPGASAASSGITPYKYLLQKENNPHPPTVLSPSAMFEQTVFLKKDNDNFHAEPVGLRRGGNGPAEAAFESRLTRQMRSKMLPSYMMPT